MTSCRQLTPYWRRGLGPSSFCPVALGNPADTFATVKTTVNALFRGTLPRGPPGVRSSLRVRRPDRDMAELRLNKGSFVCVSGSKFDGLILPDSGRLSAMLTKPYRTIDQIHYWTEYVHRQTWVSEQILNPPVALFQLRD